MWGVPGGILCICPALPTLSHLGQPPAGSTVTKHMQGGCQSWVCGKAHALKKMKLQSCTEEWGDGFNPSGSFPPAWSHLNGDLGVTQGPKAHLGDFQQAVWLNEGTVKLAKHPTQALNHVLNNLDVSEISA